MRSAEPGIATVVEACARPVSSVAQGNAKPRRRLGGVRSSECNKEVLTYIPFADHNAMIDPSDCRHHGTGRSKRSWRSANSRARPPSNARSTFSVAIRWAIRRRAGEPDGAWYGRWGCELHLRHLAGALGALRTRRRATDRARRLRRGAALAALQVRTTTAAGARLLGSYADRDADRKGQLAEQLDGTDRVGDDGARWPSAGDALPPPGDPLTEAVWSGARFVVIPPAPRRDGWRDTAWTGTGFPESVLSPLPPTIRTYFPLQALAMYRSARSDAVDLASSWTVCRAGTEDL